MMRISKDESQMRTVERGMSNTNDTKPRQAQRALLGLPSAARRAFSLVEILTVIGIIAILITLAVVGFKVVGKAAREKVTNNQLENCKSLLTEYENTNADDSLMSPLPTTVVGSASATPNDRWIGLGTPSITTFATAQLPAFSSFKEEETARIISRLRSVPANRASLEKMSSDKIKAQTFQQVTVTAAFSPSGTLPASQSVVLLDGSGHPIIFVPGGGLTGVNLGYDGKNDPSLPTSYSSPGQTIKSPDGRPFWASPGPDGNLVNGDDNTYSFGN